MSVTKYKGGKQVLCAGCSGRSEGFQAAGMKPAFLFPHHSSSTLSGGPTR